MIYSYTVVVIAILRFSLNSYSSISLAVYLLSIFEICELCKSIILTRIVAIGNTIYCLDNTIRLLKKLIVWRHWCLHFPSCETHFGMHLHSLIQQWGYWSWPPIVMWSDVGIRIPGTALSDSIVVSHRRRKKGPVHWIYVITVTVKKHNQQKK